MKHNVAAIGLRLLACLFATTLGANPAWSQAARAPDQPDFECKAGAPPWSCFGHMEIFVSMELGGRNMAFPMFHRRAIRFANREVLVESESFDGGPNGERTLGTYFVARPSGLALAAGWDTWQNPAQEAEHIMEELQRVCKLLRAAFPTGPDALDNTWRTVTVAVKEFVYPVGEQMKNKTIGAMKGDDGGVFFSYGDVGEPIGPYRLTGAWSSTKPSPRRDGVPAPYAGTGQRFTTLGQARAYVPGH
ncbi:MAG: hypothetical protein ACJ8HJ_28790 [Massilia sp.]